jgi:COP9 signalosome complex subunit 5
LDIEYFMSTQAKSVISILSKNYMWMRTLGSTPMIEPENKERVSERILNNVTSKLNGDETSSSKHGGGGGSGGGSGGASEENPLTKPVQSAEGLAVEMCEAQMTQLAKKVIFG